MNLFPLAKENYISYNISSKNSWGVRGSCNFEPTFILTGNPISEDMSGLRFAVEDRRDDEVTHLAWLGVKVAGDGTLGYYIGMALRLC